MFSMFLYLIWPFLHPGCCHKTVQYVSQAIEQETDIETLRGHTVLALEEDMRTLQAKLDAARAEEESEEHMLESTSSSSE